MQQHNLQNTKLQDNNSIHFDQFSLQFDLQQCMDSTMRNSKILYRHSNRRGHVQTCLKIVQNTTQMLNHLTCTTDLLIVVISLLLRSAVFE